MRSPTARHLLIIGAQRCGTTYLHDLLASHPQIAMARPARPEPKVFLSAELAARGREWYVETYFAHATDEILLGEKSTSYLESAAAAARAASVLQDPLILVQLRDPLQRALSHWAFSTDSGLETRPLDEVLEANLDGPLPWDPSRTSVSPFAYLERGRYVGYLEPWLEQFGADLQVLFLEETSAGAAGAADLFADLFAALGVEPPATAPGLAGPANVSTSPTTLGADLRRAVRDYYRESDASLAAVLERALPWTTATTSEGIA